MDTYDVVIFGLVAKELSRAAREKDEEKKATRIKKAITLLRSLLDDSETGLSPLAVKEG